MPPLLLGQKQLYLVHKFEMTSVTSDLDTLYAGCSAFLSAYTGTEDNNSEVLDLLVDAARDYYEYLRDGNDYPAYLALESSSHYVQTDLTEDELEDYVSAFETYLWLASEGDLQYVA